MAHALGVACTTLVLGGCAFEAPGELPAEDEPTSPGALASPVVACTAVKLTAPLPGFAVGVGLPTPLTATSTCPSNVTPEYQFWGKPLGAANWSKLGDFATGGSSTWALPWVGAFSISVVVRAVGSTQTYEARSNQVSGTAYHVNLNPTAADDDIAAGLNRAGSVDVLANDSDPDGDPVSLTGHGEAEHGAVGFVGSIATYTPGPGYLGLDSFTYTVIDGLGGSATGTVHVTVSDLPPIANTDTLASRANNSDTINVLLNDSDPDGDVLTVTTFTQGAHGLVAFDQGVATYTPVPGYVGLDAFTYTIDDGHQMTAIGTVNVTVSNPVPGCAIAISGPASGVYGANLHLTASAACNTGAAQVQWYYKVNSSYAVVQAWSAVATLDYTADRVAPALFYALVRTQGTTASQGTSNTLTVPVVDNTPQCTSVKMTKPLAAATLHVGLAQVLTALAVCPVGATAEYQFWVKASTAANWTTLPTYTTGSGTWTPAVTGTWNIKAVARSVGSHVAYQVGSSMVAVTVAP